MALSDDGSMLVYRSAYMDRGTRPSRENRLMITSIDGAAPRVVVAFTTF